MDILIFAQTLFYFSFSLTVIIVGVLMTIFLYHVVSISKRIHRGVDNVEEISSKILDKVSSLIGRLVGIVMEVVGNHKKGNKKTKNK